MEWKSCRQDFHSIMEEEQEMQSRRDKSSQYCHFEAPRRSRAKVLLGLLGHMFVNPIVLVPGLIFMLIYCCAVATLNHCAPQWQFNSSKDALSMSSLAISLVMGLRTASSYERWWEGRKLWGRLVSDCRNVALQVCEYATLTEAERNKIADLLKLFALCLKDHLRDTRYDLSSRDFGPDDSVRHLPVYIAQLLHREFNDIASENRIPENVSLAVLESLRGMMETCGGCERLKSTPIVGWFRVSIWLWLSIYLLLLPWLMVPTFGFWMIPLVMLASYFAIALESTVEQLQEPFGYDINDLTLDAICAGIEKTLAQVVELSHRNVNALKTNNL